MAFYSDSVKLKFESGKTAASAAISGLKRGPESAVTELRRSKHGQAGNLKILIEKNRRK
jgi:hypothetical protein